MQSERVKRSWVAGRPREGSGGSGGIGSQALSCYEVVGEGVPERMGLRFDQTANREKTKAVVLAIGVDALDLLAQGIDSRPLRRHRSRQP